MRVLVMCTVHDPRDARISERQIGALLAAGHQVTQAGPFTAYGVPPRSGVRRIDLPRASGRHRWAALREARRVLKREAPRHDVILLHSPELVPATIGLDHPLVVWDVHEDTAAAVTMKPWLPEAVRPMAARGIHWVESLAERHHHLLLAEDAYAERFRHPHPIIRNTPVVPAHVPPSEPGRIVYVGSLTVARGADDLIGLARLLAASPANASVKVDVVGPASGAVADRLRVAHREGVLTWHGFLDNAEALRLVEGASAGLSLLHDEANYRHSMPTKLLEYLAHGVPVVTTPLPLAVDLVQQSQGGLVVPFANPEAAADALRRLTGDDTLRRDMAEAGRAWVEANANWGRDGTNFVATLERWVAAGGKR